MTEPLEGKRPEDLLWEVLGLETYCMSALEYLVAGYLGRDDFSRHLLESDVIGRKSADWKRATLKTITEREGLSYPPYDRLPASLQALSDFRNRIAHSQPDHGDVLRRLRRHRGENQPVWELTPGEIAAWWQVGIECQSQLTFLSSLISDKLNNSPEPDNDE